MGTCFYCNPHLIYTATESQLETHFCGGDPICLCDYDLDRLADDGNPYAEFVESCDMPAWMFE